MSMLVEGSRDREPCGFHRSTALFTPEPASGRQAGSRACSSSVRSRFAFAASMGIPIPPFGPFEVYCVSTCRSESITGSAKAFVINTRPVIDYPFAGESGHSMARLVARSGMLYRSGKERAVSSPLWSGLHAHQQAPLLSLRSRSRHPLALQG
jgi:hypothetical protein